MQAEDEPVLADWEYEWCENRDGEPESWQWERKAEELGFVRQGTDWYGYPTWLFGVDWYALSDSEQRSNEDYVRACNAAYELCD